MLKEGDYVFLTLGGARELAKEYLEEGEDLKKYFRFSPPFWRIVYKREQKFFIETITFPYFLLAVEGNRLRKADISFITKLLFKASFALSYFFRK
jgi:hypothetical protein